MWVNQTNNYNLITYAQVGPQPTSLKHNWLIPLIPTTNYLPRIHPPYTTNACYVQYFQCWSPPKRNSLWYHGTIRHTQRHRIRELWSCKARQRQVLWRAFCCQVYWQRSKGSVFGIWYLCLFFFPVSCFVLLTNYMLQIDEHVEREILNHRSLKHPNIIRFKEVLLHYHYKNNLISVG